MPAGSSVEKVDGVSLTAPACRMMAIFATAKQGPDGSIEVDVFLEPVVALRAVTKRYFWRGQRDAWDSPASDDAAAQEGWRMTHSWVDMEPIICDSEAGLIGIYEQMEDWKDAICHVVAEPGTRETRQTELPIGPRRRLQPQMCEPPERRVAAVGRFFDRFPEGGLAVRWKSGLAGAFGTTGEQAIDKYSQASDSIRTSGDQVMQVGSGSIDKKSGQRSKSQLAIECELASINFLIGASQAAVL